MPNVLTSPEIAAIQMALETMIEDLKTTSSDYSLPFNKEARALMRDLLKTSQSAQEKIRSASGAAIQLDAYKAGDEAEFFTKES